MKIKITIEQLKKVLKSEKPKYPITVKMKDVSKEDLAELARLLKKKG